MREPAFTIDTPDNVSAHPKASAIYYSCAETAKIVRGELKTHFSRTKFSVRSNVYSGGASIDISWFDGPTTKDVDAIVEKFSGATFDGMQDLKEYRDALYQGRRVHFGANFIFTSRKLSPDFLRGVMTLLCATYGLEMPQIKVSEYDGSASIHDSPLPKRLQSGNGRDFLSDLLWRALPDFREV